VQFHRPPQLPILLHPMLYKSDADALYGEYYDHGRRALWLGKLVRDAAGLPGCTCSCPAMLKDACMWLAVMRTPGILLSCMRAKGVASDAA
jgi:hypothetical protein